jgi:hypothetical protein
MRAKPLSERQKETINSMNKRLSHRPVEERADFIGDYCKIRLTAHELLLIVLELEVA